MDDPKFIDDSAKGRMAVNFVKHLLEKSGYDVVITSDPCWGACAGSFADYSAERGGIRGKKDGHEAQRPPPP